YADPAEIGAADVFGIVHPDDVEPARATLGAIAAGTRGPDHPITLRIRDRGGSWHYFEIRGQNLTDDPAVHGIVITSRDGTRRRAHTAHARRRGPPGRDHDPDAPEHARRRPCVRLRDRARHP